MYVRSCEAKVCHSVCLFGLLVYNQILHFKMKKPLRLSYPPTNSLKNTQGDKKMVNIKFSTFANCLK